MGNSMRNEAEIQPNVEGNLPLPLQGMSKNRAGVRGFPARLYFDIARQRNDNVKFPQFGVRWGPFFVKFRIFPKWLQMASHGLKIIYN